MLHSLVGISSVKNGRLYAVPGAALAGGEREGYLSKVSRRLTASSVPPRVSVTRIKRGNLKKEIGLKESIEREERNSELFLFLPFSRGRRKVAAARRPRRNSQQTRTGSSYQCLLHRVSIALLTVLCFTVAICIILLAWAE